jgi:hypothetical protein
VEEGEDYCIICENRRDRPDEMNHDNSYAGESDAKRLSRLRCFLHVKQQFERYGAPDGWAVTLAGPEAAEVGVMRYLMGWPRDRVLFVDHDPRGLRRAERLWPGVDTYCGDIVDVLSFLDGGIAFAHFDFMGHLNRTAQETFERAGSMLKPHGVVMYTYFRGREQNNSTIWHLAQHYGKSVGCRTLAAKRAYRGLSEKQRKKWARTFGYLTIVIDLLERHSTGAFVPIIAGSNYQSTSPMGVLAVQKFRHAPKKADRPAIYPQIRGGDYAMRETRKLLKIMHDCGYPNRELAAIFNVAEKSIPAWLAHVTRGTYG